MSKLYVGCLAVALLALLAMPVMAAAVTDASSTADVALTIEEYCEVSYDSTSFNITLSGGGEEGSGVQGFTANANFNYQITGAITKPTDAPGTWSYGFEDDSQDPLADPIMGSAGTGTNANVKVEVAGVTLADGAGTWTGGTMIITINGQ